MDGVKSAYKGAIQNPGTKDKYNILYRMKC